MLGGHRMCRVVKAANSFDPADLTLTLYHDAEDYVPGAGATGTWPGTASAGTSGSQTLDDAATGFATPTAGVTLDSKALAGFTGSTGHRLYIDTGSNILTTTEGTICFFVRPTGAPAADPGAGLYYSVPGILSDAGGSYVNVGYSAAGITVELSETGSGLMVDRTVYVAQNEYAFIHIRWSVADGLQIGKNGVWGSAIAFAGIGGTLAQYLRFGANWDNSQFFTGDLGDIFAAQTRLSDTDVADLYARTAARFPSA